MTDSEARRTSDRQESNVLVDLRRDFVEHTKKDEDNFGAMRNSLEAIQNTIHEFSARSDSRWELDNQWKKDNQDALDNMKNITAGWKLILGIFASIAVVGAGVVYIKKALHQ